MAEKEYTIDEVIEDFDTVIANTGLTKDPHAKNITISDWNDLVNLCAKTIPNVENILKFLKPFVDGTNTALNNVNITLNDDIEELKDFKEYVSGVKSDLESRITDVDNAKLDASEVSVNADRLTVVRRHTDGSILVHTAGNDNWPKEAVNLGYFNRKKVSKIELTLTDPSDHIYTISLKNNDGELIASDTINLPLEAIKIAAIDDWVDADGVRYLKVSFVDGNVLNVPLDDVFVGLEDIVNDKLDESAFENYKKIIGEDIASKASQSDFETLDVNFWNTEGRVTTIESEVSALYDRTDNHESRISFIEDTLVTTEEDKSTAYEKTVPAGVSTYAALDFIGGASYKSKNFYNPDAPNWNERTFDVDENGGIVITPDNIDDMTIVLPAMSFAEAGTHYIYFTADFEVPFMYTVTDSNVGYAEFSGDSGSASIDADFSEFGYDGMSLVIDVLDPEGFEGGTIYIMVSTEPITEFEPYFEGVRDAKVTAIVSKGAHLSDPVDIFTIPQAIQELEGYGKDGFVLDFDTKTAIYNGNTTDLSAYLTYYGYKTLVVEAGGKVVFENEHKYAVPSSITYVKTSGGGSSAIGSIAKALVRNGVGCIDTGVDGANSNLTIKIQYEFISMPTTYFNLIRAYVDESTNSTRIIYNKHNNVYVCLNSVPSQSLLSSSVRYANVIYTDILQPESTTTFSYTANGVKTTKTRTSGSSLIGHNLILFPTTSSNDNVSIKVYSLQIFDGDTLIRDYVPFTLKSGECGMYDYVTKQFYGNDGSGAFEVERFQEIKE